MSTSRFIRYILLLSLAGALLYIAWYLQTKELVDTPEQSNEPQLELYDFEIVRYTPEGQKNYTLSGPYSKHYEDEKGTLITEPFLTHFLETDPTKIDWTSKSLEATISQDQSLITLDQEVELTTIDQKTDELTVLETSQLLIHDRGEKITSERFVTVDTINKHMEGVGLIGYPKLGSYTLLKDSMSTYDAKK